MNKWTVVEPEKDLLMFAKQNGKFVYGIDKRNIVHIKVYEHPRIKEFNEKQSRKILQTFCCQPHIYQKLARLVLTGNPWANRLRSYLPGGKDARS